MPFPIFPYPTVPRSWEGNLCDDVSLWYIFHLEG